MKNIFVIFLFISNSFLYGLSIELLSAINNIEFLEKTPEQYKSDPNYEQVSRGKGDNIITYGVQISHVDIFDIKYETSKNEDYTANENFYSLAYFELTPFAFLSLPYLENMVLDVSKNEYQVIDGNYPIILKQKGLSIGWQLSDDIGRIVYGFIYREDDEYIRYTNTTENTKVDNYGVHIKFDTFKLLGRAGPVDNGIGFILDDIDFQITNELHKFDMAWGFGYKKDDTEVYLKHTFILEGESLNDTQRDIDRVTLGFKQTF